MGSHESKEPSKRSRCMYICCSDARAMLNTRKCQRNIEPLSSTDGTAAIWDLASCSVLCSFVQPSRLGVRCCRFSPDSSMLVTSGK